MLFALLRSRPAITKLLRKNHYSTLGIVYSADKKEIKKAYLDKAKKYHPDANPTDPKASETFQKIQQAYETLSDADTKIEYDRNHVKRSTPPSGFNQMMDNEEVDDEWMGHNAFNSAYNTGFTSGDRRRRPGGQGTPFDPWDHAFRDNQAKRMWQMAMDMEHGDGHHWEQPHHNYENDDQFFDEKRKHFYEQFIVDDFFNNPSNNESGNESHQRFHYKDFSKWDSQRSVYENRFNKKYGFKQSKTKQFRDRKQEQYWETDPPVQDDYTTYGFSAPDDNVYWDAWMDNWYTDNSSYEYKAQQSAEKAARRKAKNEKYKKEKKKRDQSSSDKNTKSADTKKSSSPKNTKSESTKNSERVHAQLNEFGEAMIEMDGVQFILEVEKDGSISMSPVDKHQSGNKTKKWEDSKRKKARKRRKEK